MKNEDEEAIVITILMFLGTILLLAMFLEVSFLQIYKKLNIKHPLNWISKMLRTPVSYNKLKMEMLDVHLSIAPLANPYKFLA